MIKEFQLLFDNNIKITDKKLLVDNSIMNVPFEMGPENLKH